jgi:hypothetical protein
MNCDCPDCTRPGPLARAWRWLDSDPGPVLSLLPWALLGFWIGFCLF